MATIKDYKQYGAGLLLVGGLGWGMLTNAAAEKIPVLEKISQNAADVILAASMLSLFTGAGLRAAANTMQPKF